jgi:hypothetical protein
MNKTPTLENLLQYAYGDYTDSIQEQTISHLIRSGNALYEEYLQIMETKQMIEKSFTDPSDEVINRIISYSKALADIDIAEPDLRLMIRN